MGRDLLLLRTFKKTYKKKGIIITILLIEYAGRRTCIAIEYFVFAVFVLLLNIFVSRNLMIFFIFVARCFISGAFQAIYVYTPEYYPTAMRAIGLGSCSAMARVGAIITPFVAQILLKISPNLAISIYGCVALAAAICAFSLPVETKGRVLHVSGRKILELNKNYKKVYQCFDFYFKRMERKK